MECINKRAAQVDPCPEGVQGTNGCGTRCSGLVDKVGINLRLDPMILEVFSSMDSVIPCPPQVLTGFLWRPATKNIHQKCKISVLKSLGFIRAPKKSSSVVSLKK